MIILIAEKRSQAELIAKALGLSSGQGVYKGVFENKETVIWYAAGHLVEPIPPSESISNFSWSDPITHEKIPKKITLRAIPDTPAKNNKPARTPQKKIDQLASLIKSAELVIGACDPDREGEVIYRTILEYINYNGPLERIWLSKGLTIDMIRKAYSEKKHADAYEGTYLAGLGRRIADYSSMVLTSTYTFYGRKGLLGQHLGSGSTVESTVSVGRVQTSTLYMFYQRKKERDEFVPVTHYKPIITVPINNKALEFNYDMSGQEESDREYPGVTWFQSNSASSISSDMSDEDIEKNMDNSGMKPRLTGLQELNHFRERLLNVSITVETSEQETISVSPPPPLSLTKLQGQFSNYSAKRVLEAAESLYLKGFISYPRTEETKISKDNYNEQALKATFSSLQTWDAFLDTAGEAMQIHCTNKQEEAPFFYTDKDIAHDALAPLIAPPEDSISGLEKEVFMAISNAFIRAHLPASNYNVLKTNVTAPVAGMFNENPSRFTLKTKVCTSLGWEEFYKEKETQLNADLPEFIPGKEVSTISEVTLKSSTTKKPPLFTESSILLMMYHAGRLEPDPELRKALRDSKGIGTTATRANILQTLFKRGYITNLKGSQLDITEKGIELIQVVPKSFLSPGTTAKWEVSLKKIEDAVTGSRETIYHDFINHQVQSTEELIKYLNKNLLEKAKSRTVNPNMPLTNKTKEIAIKRAKGLGLSFPRNILTSELLARQWLEQNPWKVTSAMLRKIDQIALYTGHKLTENEKGDFKSAISFIKKHEAQLPSAKPSEKAKRFAQDIALRNGISIPEATLSDSKLLKRFIDSNKNIKKPTSSQISKINKLSTALGVKVDVKKILSYSHAEKIIGQLTNKK